MADSPLDVTMGVPAPRRGSALDLPSTLTAGHAASKPGDTTSLAPLTVNDDTLPGDDEETLSATTPDAFCCATVYYKYVCYRGRWQESVAYIGGVGRRA